MRDEDRPLTSVAGARTTLRFGRLFRRLLLLPAVGGASMVTGRVDVRREGRPIYLSSGRVAGSLRLVRDGHHAQAKRAAVRQWPVDRVSDGQAK